MVSVTVPVSDYVHLIINSMSGGIKPQSSTKTVKIPKKTYTKMVSYFSNSHINQPINDTVKLEKKVHDIIRCILFDSEYDLSVVRNLPEDGCWIHGWAWTIIQKMFLPNLLDDENWEDTCWNKENKLLLSIKNNWIVL